MSPAAPVLALYGPDDADWGACLLLDLRARGLDVLGLEAPARLGPDIDPGALLVVRSWNDGGRLEPPGALVRRVRAHGGAYIVARRNGTILGRDDCPGRTHALALWDDYYQPVRTPAGKGDAGFANLLEILGGSRAVLDLPAGYVFISYHFGADGAFVHDRVRPVLSHAGLTSWAYRTSERIPDDDTRGRLDEIIRHASVLLVASTPKWWTSWCELEVRAARRHRVPVVAVQPAGTRRSRRAVLADVPSVVLDTDSRTAAALVDTLLAAGTRPTHRTGRG
jgi:hypothetical protein